MEKFEHTHRDATLIRKILLEEANEAERLEFETRLSECPELQKVYEQLQDRDMLKSSFNEYETYSSKKGYQSFLRHVGQVESKMRRRQMLKIGWCAAAAMVVLAIGVSFYLSNDNLVEDKVEIVRTVIQPGRQQAQLALSDGSVIDVNKEKDVSVVVDGVQVQYKEGILSYQDISKSKVKTNEAEEESVKSNELITPCGGENIVILADGTKVYLNAGSKLIYPVRFFGKRRVVTLEGEAYFDVAKNEDQPFVVHTHLGDITVLGTAFNVNAYTDASACYTTLVSGKVNLTTLQNSTITLLPGEQAIVSADKTEKHAVDVEEYVGWVSGVYTFNNRALEDIMKTFARWYDIQVYFETAELRNITYSGSLKRHKSINSWLDALELTGDIAYRINGRNVLIYDKTKE